MLATCATRRIPSVRGRRVSRRTRGSTLSICKAAGSKPAPSAGSASYRQRAKPSRKGSAASAPCTETSRRRSQSPSRADASCKTSGTWKPSRPVPTTSRRRWRERTSKSRWAPPKFSSKDTTGDLGQEDVLSSDPAIASVWEPASKGGRAPAPNRTSAATSTRAGPSHGATAGAVARVPRRLERPTVSAAAGSRFRLATFPYRNLE